VAQISVSGIGFESSAASLDCSASLIRFETSRGSDRAMILTNGHCLKGKMLKSGEIQINKKSYRSFKLLERGGKRLGFLHTDLLILGTMTGTDIGLYRLQQTYDEIARRYGVYGLTLSSQHPLKGAHIAIVAALWHSIYECDIDGFVPQLLEDQYTMRDSIRYTADGCDLVPGTSGSPIIDVASGKVVGVHNTKNEKGRKCTLDNPYEIDESGNVSVLKGRSYGQETYWIYGCLNSDNQLDLSKPGCELASP